MFSPSFLLVYYDIFNTCIINRKIKECKVYSFVNDSVLFSLKHIINLRLHILFMRYSIMKRLKRYTIIGIIFVLITGTLAHFLYDWTRSNHIVGLFTPINESVWEHMKLLFFPMLLYSLMIILKFRQKYSCITSALCFGILAGTLLIPLFYYAYTSILGRNIFILDIGSFILSIIIAFRLSYKLTLSCRLESYTSLLCIMMCILFVCFLMFTCYPPDLTIFQDPANSQTA